jgi:hypothetical protein
MKLYIGTIKNNIPKDFDHIVGVEKHRNNKIYLKENNDWSQRGYKYSGRLPKDNSGRVYFWKDDYFSSIEELN